MEDGGAGMEDLAYSVTAKVSDHIQFVLFRNLLDCRPNLLELYAWFANCNGRV